MKKFGPYQPPSSQYQRVGEDPLPALPSRYFIKAQPLELLQYVAVWQKLWGSMVLTVSFPSPAQPLNLCMICEETIHYDFPCFVASFISLFILVGLGSQLLGG